MYFLKTFIVLLFSNHSLGKSSEPPLSVCDILSTLILQFALIITLTTYIPSTIWSFALYDRLHRGNRLVNNSRPRFQGLFIIMHLLTLCPERCPPQITPFNSIILATFPFVDPTAIWAVISWQFRRYTYNIHLLFFLYFPTKLSIVLSFTIITSIYNIHFSNMILLIITPLLPYFYPLRSNFLFFTEIRDICRTCISFCLAPSELHKAITLVAFCNRDVRTARYNHRVIYSSKPCSPLSCLPRALNPLSPVCTFVQHYYISQHVTYRSQCFAIRRL